MDTPLTGSRAGNSITPSKKVSFSEICSTHFANFIFADEGVATKSTTMHFIYRFESAGTEQYFVILRKKVEQGTDAGKGKTVEQGERVRGMVRKEK